MPLSTPVKPCCAPSLLRQPRAMTGRPRLASFLRGMRKGQLAALLLLATASAAAAMPSMQPEPAAPSLSVGEAGTSEATVVDVPPNPRRARWYGRAGVGFAYRWAFDQSMLGVSLDGELGAQNPRLAGGVRLHIEAGGLLAGLPFQAVTFGPVLWLPLAQRFRIGLGVEAGALVLSRRTMPARSMWTVMLGGHIAGSVDLLRLGASGALHLDTSLGAYALTLAPGPVSILTTLGLGYRP